MENFHLQISHWGLIFSISVLSLALFLQWSYRKNENSPSVLYSDTETMESLEKSWRIKLINLPLILRKLTFLLFILALCDPIINFDVFKEPLASLDEGGRKTSKGIESAHIPTEGLAIYFVLDQSGSMREEIDFSMPHQKPQRMTRIDALKFFTSQFILGNEQLNLKGRRDDLVGLVGFARIPQIITPLTLDHQEVHRRLKDFSPVNHPMAEGTAIGYAIYKTAHTIAATEHFSRELLGDDKPAYDIKSTVMILVTDGLQNPSSEDLEHPIRRIGIEESAEFAKEKGIRLYIVNVQPAIDFPELRAERDSQKKAAELTGGQFFLASDAQSLHRIYRVIDSLERSKHYGTHKQHVDVEESTISSENREVVEIHLYAYLMLIGLFALLMAIIFETTLLKQVP